MNCVDCGIELPYSKWKIRCKDCWKIWKNVGNNSDRHFTNYEKFGSQSGLKICSCEDYPCCGH